VVAGIVAVFLKVFSMGGLYPGPVIGIAGEAILVELAFLVTRGRAVGAVLGGALALTVNPVQKVLMTWVVAGPEALRAAVRTVQAAADRVGLSGVDGAAILLTLASVSGAIGAVIGALAWLLAGRTLRRLGRAP
jgi:hypothetical protein